MVSAYTLIVQAVQQFNNKSLIDQLSLYGSDDLNETRTQFHVGEILTVQAKVREGDVYSVNIYDKNGSVFSQNGRILGSEALVQVPLDPPSFCANESYMVVFYASISVYPIPGAFATDTKIAAFNVISADTKLYLTSVYDDNSSKLSLHVSLENEDGSPVANETVRFYLQPNCSAVVQDRGWVLLTAARTDANGAIFLPMLCRLYAGLHYVMAKFDGDGDFGASENVTSFYTALRVPRLSITSVSSSLDQTDVSARVVDEQGYPLFGKVLTVDLGNSAGAQNLLSTTDENGDVAMSLTGSERSALNQSTFEIRQDMFTSEVSISFRNLTSTKNLATYSSSAVENAAPQPRYAANYQDASSLSVSPKNPYAVLPMMFNATYTGYVPATTNVTFYFRLDGIYFSESVSLLGQGQHEYVGLYVWCPDVLGSHFMQVQVCLLNGTLLNQMNSGNFTIAPCPCNLEIYAPQVNYGNSANVTLVFSTPRAYQCANGSGLFYSYNLAPGFNYTGTVYKMDNGISAVTVRLYCNCTDAYLRDVKSTVNGLSAYNLSALQGNGYAENWLSNPVNTATWGIRVWNRSSSGVETELTSGTPVAQVQRSALGEGLQNSTWNCSSVHLAPNASLVVRWYVGAGSAPSTWTLLASSTTGQLGATRLNASTWRVCYYTMGTIPEEFITRRLPYKGHPCVYGLAWGEPPYNTRIINFTYPPSSGGFTDLTLGLHNGASTGNWTVNMMNRQRVAYDFKLQVVDPLFQQNVTSRIITFSRVAVNAGNGNKYLELNCSLTAANQSSPQVYVGANSTVQASVNLFGMPVYNANASIIYAQFVPAARGYIKTGVSVARTLQIPSGANFLRVVYVYNSSYLDGDIDYQLLKSDDWSISADGWINAMDLSLITGNWNKAVPPADPRADINHDGMVNQTDANILSACAKEPRGCYLPSFGAVACFSDGENRSLDSAGCVAIPASAQGGSVGIYLNKQPVGAFILFFNATSEDESLRTDASGVAEASWTPSTVGDYLLEVKLSPSFNTVVSQPESTTSVSESVCLVKYVQVVPRPVDLNVTSVPSGNALAGYWNLDASNDTYQDINYNYGANGPFSDPQRLRIGVAYLQSPPSISAFRTYIRFDAPPRHPDALITQATLTLYGNANFTTNPPGHNNAEVRYFEAYAINQSWNEENLYNPPGYNQSFHSNIIQVNNKTTCEIDFDVTNIVQSWYNGTLPNFGFVIKDLDESTQYLQYSSVFEANSSESVSSQYWPKLVIWYNRPKYTVNVNATDPVPGGKPITGLTVNFNGANKVTRNGVASFTLYPSSVDPLGVVGGVVRSYPTQVFEAASVNVSLDTRHPTSLMSEGGSNVTCVAGLGTDLDFRLSCPSQHENLTGVEVYFFVDPPNTTVMWSSCLNCEVLWGFNASYIATTGSDGVAVLNYEFTPGTHTVYAAFDGFENTLWQYNDTTKGLFYNYTYGDWYQPCNVSMVAVASAIPLGIDFSVLPSELDLSHSNQLTLNATVLDLRSNSVFVPSYSYTVNFTQINPNGAITHWWAVTQKNNGKFLKTITYPGGTSAYAYEAQVVGTQNLLQSLASSPTQLTVGTATRLLLNVTRDFDSTRHVFLCRLLSNGSPVYNRTITLKLNSTVYDSTKYPSLVTNTTGCAWIPLYLTPQANNNQTVFNVVASFSGDSASTVTATMTTINGTTYAVCTTTQYNTYEPSSNSTSITVMPQTTTGATTRMSMNQLQADAKSSGWLSFYNEFSLGYPWYRLHFVLDVPLPPYGTIYVNYGWSPLPLGISFQSNTTVFALMLNDIGTKIATDVILGIAVGYMIQRVAAGLAGRTIVGMGVAIAAYLGYSLGSAWALYATSGNSPKAWLVAFLSSAIGSFMDLILQGLNAAWQWLTAVSRYILGEITCTLNSMWARGLDFFDITGVAFTFIDFALMIGYLSLYETSV
jgi:hypothetical protein